VLKDEYLMFDPRLTAAARGKSKHWAKLPTDLERDERNQKVA
jgi:hypothetical protein